MKYKRSAEDYFLTPDYITIVVLSGTTIVVPDKTTIVI